MANDAGFIKILESDGQKMQKVHHGCERCAGSKHVEQDYKKIYTSHATEED